MYGPAGGGYGLLPGGHVGNVVVMVAALEGAGAHPVELEEVVAPAGQFPGLGVDVLLGTGSGEVQLVGAVPAVGGAQVAMDDVGGGAAVGVPDRHLAVSVGLLLQPDGQVDAGLEALGVDVVGDGLHAVREAAGVGLLAGVPVEPRLPVPVPPPAGVDVDVLVAVLLQPGGEGVGLLQDVRLGEIAVVAVRVETGVLGRLHAPTGPAHVGPGGRCGRGDRGDRCCPCLRGGRGEARGEGQGDGASESACGQEGVRGRPHGRYLLGGFGTGRLSPVRCWGST